MDLGRSSTTGYPSGHAPAPRRRPRRWPPAAAGALAGALAVVLVLTGPAAADPGQPAEPPGESPQPTTLALDAPPARAGEATLLRVLLTGPDGGPVVDAPVGVERRVDGEWLPFADLVTDGTGAASAEAVLRKDPADNLFRAAYAGGEGLAGSSTGPVRAELRKRSSRVRLTGPRTVVDERRAALRVRVTAGDGTPLAVRVVVQRKERGGTWRRARVLGTGDDGRARLVVRPRVDTRWRARVRPLPWLRGDTSRVHRLDNLPPGERVRLPKGAPRPRIRLPRQRRAVGDGPNAVVTRVPDRVWRSMVGRSWHRGCPVGRAGLRHLRINYWGYDGYRYRGELVAAEGAVGQMAAALSEMYRRRLPIRAMYRVDRFGWSKRLQGADDYRSMAAGNTSAFNCRQVVGRPGVRSPHSYGRALDVNPWENPYRASHGWTPNSWWVGRSHPRVAWRSRSHPVVALMARHGLRWTYGTSDAHHFDATGGSGRVLVPRACRGAEVCK